MTTLAENLPGNSIGFVPTMGALHEGHLSLVKKSSSENDATIVSIFVNPTQFNDPKDFDRYPREVARDLNFLRSETVAAIFLPDTAEIYPNQDLIQYELGNLTSVMEGAFRPGHFNGVASVVKRLFEIVKPDKAYFGLKDFQQFQIIKKLNEQYELGVDIVGCETIRDTNGLALSSRNALLSVEERTLAVHLSETLKLMASRSQRMSHLELEDFGKNHLKGYPDIEVEYVKVVDPETLMPPLTTLNRGERLALLAAKIGKVRLIDNMKV